MGTFKAYAAYLGETVRSRIKNDRAGVQKNFRGYRDCLILGLAAQMRTVPGQRAPVCAGLFVLNPEAALYVFAWETQAFLRRPGQAAQNRFPTLFGKEKD